MIDDFRPVKRPAKSLSTMRERMTGNEHQDSNPQTNAAPTTEPSFETPDQAAANDDQPAVPATEAAPDEPGRFEPPIEPKADTKSGWKAKLALRWPPGKKEYIALAAALLLIGGGATGYIFLKPATKPTAHTAGLVIKPKPAPPQPTTVASNLTGLPVDPSLNSKPVTGVMIENSIDARPQSGLGQAGVVFEAVAEGGVTRFLALFQDTAPANIGPVRSARPYYVSWDLGFDAPYAHVGGSPDGLADITAWGVKDMNQFYNGGSFQRVSSRQAPHNVYSSAANLNQLEAGKGWGASKFAGWPRKADSPSKTPTARTIHFSLSGPVYDPTFTYSAGTNSYLRSMYGSPHVDANTNQQIAPKVVIAIVMQETRGALDSSGAYYSNYTTIGNGQAYIFQDGTLTIGNWNKPDNNTNINFTDASGNAIKLNAGQTWITAVTSTGAITYTP